MKKKLIIVLTMMLTIFMVNIFKYNYSNKYNYKYDNMVDVKIFNTDYFNFEKNVLYNQTIFSKYDYLNNISIYIDPINNLYDNKDYISVYLKMTLKDENKKIIEQYKLEKVFLENGGIIDFKFKPIKNSKNKKYYLEIESFDSIKNENINFLKLNTDNKNYNLMQDENDNNYTLYYTTQYKSKKSYVIFIVMSISCLVIFLILLIILLKNSNMKIENKYAIIAIIIGLMLIIFIPSYAGNDETSHFVRAYEISKGYLVTRNIDDWPKAEVPSKVFNRFYKYIDISEAINTKENKIELYNMEYSSVYSIFAYIPQIFAIILCNLFINNIFWWPYIIRIFQLLFCVYLIYIAIKIIPYGKEKIFVIGLIPTVLRQISLISADAIMISTAILYISYLLYVNNKDKIRKIDFIFLLLLAIFLSLSKLVYIPLILISFVLIKNKKIKTKKMFSIILIISLLVTILWNYFAMHNLTSGQGVNVNYYLKYYLRNPFDFIFININTLFTLGYKYIIELFSGLNMPYKLSNENLNFIVFIALYLIVSLKSYNPFNKKEKIFIISIIILVILLINSSLLVTCTPIYTSYIIGIQGRYFTPLLLPISLLFGSKKNKKNSNNSIYELIILVTYYIYINSIIFSFS
ncbi:MAG: DUF2142 domain-containing protein [Firmicutes bacterium]|nr:DUF2142 domain-containing protein [Bacillota bacterium]